MCNLGTNADEFASLIIMCFLHCCLFNTSPTVWLTRETVFELQQSRQELQQVSAQKVLALNHAQDTLYLCSVHDSYKFFLLGFPTRRYGCKNRDCFNQVCFV